MIRVQFNDKASFRDVEFSIVSESSVRLEGDKLKSNNSGFKAYRLNGAFLGDYSDYTNCEPSGDGFVFTKDANIEK